MPNIIEKMKFVSCGSVHLIDAQSNLHCHSCGRDYRIENGIPDMLLQETIEQDPITRISLEFYNRNSGRYAKEWERFEPRQIDLREDFLTRAKQRAGSPDVWRSPVGPGGISHISAGAVAT